MTNAEDTHRDDDDDDDIEPATKWRGDEAVLRRPTSIVIASGLALDLLRPEPEHVDAFDLAWALAAEGRYAEHARRRLPVAAHTLQVAAVIDAALIGTQATPTRRLELRLAALLHDASEAYTGDVARPLKRAMQAEPDSAYRAVPWKGPSQFDAIEGAVPWKGPSQFDAIEDRLAEVIGARFRIGLEPLPEIVKAADVAALAWEQARFLPLPESYATPSKAQDQIHVSASGSLESGPSPEPFSRTLVVSDFLDGLNEDPGPGMRREWLPRGRWGLARRWFFEVFNTWVDLMLARGRRHTAAGREDHEHWKTEIFAEGARLFEAHDDEVRRRRLRR